MNRRKALLVSLFTGGMLPLAARGQDPRGRVRDAFEEDEPIRGARVVGRRPAAEEPPPRAEIGFDAAPAREADPPLDSPPANFRDESGHTWLDLDIARYTKLAYLPENPSPQNALVEWIFRRTGSAIWHGEKIAVLSAGRARLRAYHNPKVLGVVREQVERFTDASADVLNVRVRFLAAQDPRWRYAVYSRLNRVASGPHGQQIWTLTREDFNLLQSQLLIQPNFRLLADQRLKLVNGQTLTVDTTEPLDYFSGPRREGSAGLGAQPSVGSLREGIVLKFSPLLTHLGDELDAAIDLKATTIKKLHRTKILARRDVGPADMALDVPEVTEARLNQTVERWPLGQTLLISAGIAPGILQSKNGFLRLPGTVPTDTEVLVFVDVEPEREPASRAPARRGEDYESEPPPRASARRGLDDYER